MVYLFTKNRSNVVPNQMSAVEFTSAHICWYFVDIARTLPLQLVVTNAWHFHLELGPGCLKSCSDRHVPSMDHMRQSQDRSQWQSPFQQRPLGQEDSTFWHCLISWLRNEKVSHAETGSEGLLWMKYEIPYPQERQNHGAPPPSHPALTTAMFPVWRVLVSRSSGLKLASKNTAYLYTVYVSVLVSTIVCSV